MDESHPFFDHTPEFTPVERHGGILCKRDDTYRVAGITGGKVRTCWSLMQGAAGVVTAGARHSPQVSIVARLAHRLGIPARCHTATGATTPELADAVAHGAELVCHKPGYNSVIVARATEDAKVRAADGWRYIPFGMECQDAVDATAAQVASLPFGEFKRIVIPIGSGMSAAGLLKGLRALPGRPSRTKVLGVQVGAAPFDRLGRWVGGYWSTQLTVVPALHPYHKAVNHRLGSLVLDPIYEAKCVDFLMGGDLLWVVGRRVDISAAADK